MSLLRNLRQESTTILTGVVLVGLTGLVYIYPFHTHFRFTVSVTVLATLLIYFPRIPAVTTATLCGAVICIGRIVVQVLFDKAGFPEVVWINLPALFYYLLYGSLFSVLQVRQLVNNALKLVLMLSLIDVFCNIFELVIRADLFNGDRESIFTSLVAVAILRALLTVGAYYALRRYQSFILAEEQMARYTELTVMIAQLKAELYYLNKSSQDIERVMEESYWLYKSLHAKNQNGSEGSNEAAQALTIARNIHEVKKDYYRVVTGIEGILRPSTKVKGMSLPEIFFIIEQNTLRFLKGTHKKIDISFHYDFEFTTDQHYMIVSLLDNLITNAIEACGETGKIKVEEYRDAGNIILSVEDNGCGIKPEDADLVFQVGYSTKFCRDTGRMSTGLGLAHVKNLTEMLEGSVELVSGPCAFTQFKLVLPVKNIVLPF
ncbi:MAG TPA: ATP-binding protein [Selenomonadales bacterium]|nr:ATP-binding protein [Selenomonadales bacterium]